MNVDTDIAQLAKMMRARRAAGVAPYTLLLGSSLSLTPAVRRAVCDSEDWEAFWETVCRTSPAERRALMHEPLSQLDLRAGCEALAQLVGAGYFNVVLTLSVDDALDNALKKLPASEYRVWVHGEVSSPEIVTALDRPTPRIKVVKLRGDVNAYKLPLTPEATFEFPRDLEETVTRYLRHDTVIVGDLPFDDDVQRCIRGGDGALWVIAVDSGDFLERAKRIRKVGEAIAAEFNAFFTALAEALGLGEAEEAAPEMAFVPPEERVNPYRGLKPFEPEHARYFFGREALTEMLVERLRRERFLAVLGASGSGKSSVVRAGVLPALAEGQQLPGSENWPVLVIKPGQNPQEALAGALAATVSAARSAGAVDFARLQETRQEIQERLLREESALHKLVAEVVAKSDDDRRVVVVIDQFEELFTLCPFEQRQRFIDALLYAVGQPDGHTTALLTLRADFVAQCTAYPDLSDLISSHQVWARAMDDAGLRAAIERPLWLAGMRFELGLVPLILADVGREPGALPLLEDALWSLFEYCRQGDEFIAAQEYREIGGVQGALAQRADDVYATLSAEEQEVTRRILLQLVEMREGQGATRRRATLDELITAPEERDPVEKVVQRLTDARLLTTTQEEETGRNVVDISHEALIRGWPRLQEWLEASREDLLTRQRLREAAAEWERGERHESYLYRGARLAKVVEWRTAHGGERCPDDSTGSPQRLVEGLNELERAFLEASVEMEERAAREEEARRQRELEQAQALAEEQRQRAEAERQRAEEQVRVRKRLGTLTVVLAVVFLLAVGGAVYAGIQQQRAKTEANARATEVVVRSTAEANARENEQLAITREAEAVAAQGTAVAERDRADLQAQIALARQLAAQAGLIPSTKGGSLTLAGLLAAEAFHRLPEAAETVAVMYEVLGRLGRPVARLDHKDGVVSAVFSPDGRRVATIGGDGIARVWKAETGQEVARLEHEGAVRSAFFSPDGRWVATASEDGTARMWEAETGQEIARLEHEGAVSSAVFSPDGRWVATASEDGTAWVWEVETGQEIARLEHEGAVSSAVFSPDGRWVATASEDGTARVWEAETGQEMARLEHEGAVSSAFFSPDGRWVATVSRDARVWETATGHEVAQMEHRVGVRSAAFSPDGRWLATVSVDLGAWVWEAATGQQVARLGSGVVSAAFSPDGRWIATATLGGTARVWEVETGQEVARLEHGREVSSAVFSPDGRWVATASEDGTARLWEAATGQEVVRLEHEREVSWAIFSPDGRWVATASEDGAARLWEVGTGQEVARLEHKGTVWSADFSPDGRWVATASEDGTARVWEVATGQEVTQLKHEDTVGSVVFSPEGQRLATRSGNTAWVWEVSTAKEVARLEHMDRVTSVDFAPNGRQLATGSLDGTARVWDVATGRELTRLEHEGLVQSAVFSPDGRWVATAATDRPPSGVWDAVTGEAITQLYEPMSCWALAFSPDGRWVAMAGTGVRGDQAAWVREASTGRLLSELKHENRVTAVVFSPDGGSVATTSWDSTARVWEAVTGQEVARLVHVGSVESAAFSPDGRWVATASEDGVARVWEANTGQEVAHLEHGDAVWSVAFSPDGWWLVTASSDGTARVWPAPERLQQTLCTRLTRNLTQAEWDQFIGPDILYECTCPDLPPGEGAPPDACTSTR